jgi:hypothetical protein
MKDKTPQHLFPSPCIHEWAQVDDPDADLVLQCIHCNQRASAKLLTLDTGSLPDGLELLHDNPEPLDAETVLHLSKLHQNKCI